MLTIRDELHLAMGEFLTECSNLENVVVSLLMFCQPRRDFNEVHLEMLDKTFGARLREFKKICGAYQFTAPHRATIDEAIIGLDDLLPRRNLIIHGTTFEVSFGEKEAKAYRIWRSRSLTIRCRSPSHASIAIAAKSQNTPNPRTA